MLSVRMLSMSTTLRAFHHSPATLAPVKGKVISWIGRGGYGFVEDEAKKQHFVHATALMVQAGGYPSLSVGQSVEFEIVSGTNGKTKADKVTGPSGMPLPPGSRPPPRTRTPSRPPGPPRRQHVGSNLSNINGF